MDRTRFVTDRLRRRAQTLGYVGGSLALLLLAAWIVFGLTGTLWLLLTAAIVLTLQGQLPIHALLRMRGATPIAAYQAPRVHRLLRELASRAELSRVPVLYYVPRREPEAFTVASGDDSAIAISRGMLDLLDHDELAGVLAHEVSHVRARDTRLLSLMHSMRQLTGSIALFGLLGVLLGVVGVLPPVSPLVPLLLVVPGISMAATMAVSRTREFDADLGAAELLGDPEPLARALWKLDRFNRGLLRFFGASLESLVPRSLMTHPPTRERVERLMQLIPRHRGTSRTPPRQVALRVRVPALTHSRLLTLP
jgi:heat shock protein HtpX